MNLSTQIILLALLVLGSAYFSGTEASLMSINRIRIKNAAGNGNKRASLVLKFTENFDKVISTLLIGNNIVNILATSIATVLFTTYFPKYGVTLSTIVMTVIVLIFGEICPKSMAKQRPEAYAMISAPLFKIIMWILTPLSLFFSPISKLAARLLKGDDAVGSTEEELITRLDEVEEGGGLEADESELIRSAIEFNDVEVEEVITRRVNMIAVEDDMTTDEVRDMFFEHGFSRLPVYHETIDNVIGILHEKDFMAHITSGGTEYLSLITEAVYVPKSIKISALLKKLQKCKTHMAIVLDEGGGIEGIVTMEDILEELVGEIWDEHDEVEVMFQKINEDQWIIDGAADMDDMFENLELLQDPDEFESTTVGGWLMEQLEDIPQEGEKLEFGGFTFTVSKADKRSVIEVVAKRLPRTETFDEDERLR